MTEPTNLSNYGGVTYDPNSLVKKWTTNENGATRYHLILNYSTGKSGETVEVSYPQQKDTNKASIFTDGICCSITNLAYGNYVDCKSSNDIWMRGCRGTTVDLSNSNERDRVFVRDSDEFKSTQNSIIGAIGDVCEFPFDNKRFGYKFKEDKKFDLP